MKKAVESYNAKGVLVGVYDSAKDAAKAHGVGVANISNCVLGKQSTSAGLTWKFAEPETKNKNPQRRNFKAVQAINDKGSVVATYESVKEAAKAHNVSKDCISNCIAGRQKTSAGLKWVFSDDKKQMVKLLSCKNISFLLFIKC